MMRVISAYGLLVAVAATEVVAVSSIPNHELVPGHLERRQNNPSTSTSTAFDALATDNVGVYFGHAENNSNPSMYPLCTSPDVNIVMLSFLRQFNGPDTQPTYDFGATCQSSGSSLPSSCPELATNISLCQSLGKKVFLSLGGSSSNIVFASADNATQSAQILWDIFGGGSPNQTTRPFGNVTIDGVDFGEHD